MSDEDVDPHERGYFHDRVTSDPAVHLQVHVPGREHCTVSFVGREDTGTVTAYTIDAENPTGPIPIFETSYENFELLLEQASAALMDAKGEDFNHFGPQREPAGPGGPGGDA